MIYPPKRDWPLAAVGLLGGLLFSGVGLLLLASGGAFLLALGIYWLWVLIWTSYEIAPPDLRVRCGPFRLRIPLAAIEEVTPSYGLFAFDWPERDWSTTWSPDKLRIIYRGKSGKTKFSLVAPKDRVSFVAELARVAPGLRVVDETALLRIESDPDEPSPP